MDKFLTANTTQLWPGYKLASGVAATNGKMNAFTSYLKVGQLWYNAEATTPLMAAPYAAPMQAFLLVPKVARPAISAHVSTMISSTAARDALRSGESETVSEPLALLVSVSRSNGTEEPETSRALMLFDPSLSNNYLPEEDSYRLFPEGNDNALIVYTRSADGYALDINSFGDTEQLIPVGIHSSQIGTMTLSFEGLEAFNGAVYLRDAVLGQTIDLRQTPFYAFDKDEDEVYLDQRFYLSIYKMPTSITEMNRSTLAIVPSQDGIDIFTRDGSAIASVKIVDLQGRTLADDTKIATSSRHYRVPKGVYVVRATASNGIVTQKIWVK
jgi:hypothetical protein